MLYYTSKIMGYDEYIRTSATVFGTEKCAVLVGRVDMLSLICGFINKRFCTQKCIFVCVMEESHYGKNH